MGFKGPSPIRVDGSLPQTRRGRSPLILPSEPASAPSSGHQSFCDLSRQQVAAQLLAAVRVAAVLKLAYQIDCGGRQRTIAGDKRNA
jgi:hypothetical protein